MKKQGRLLIALCTIAIAGLLALQFYWIHNYYAVNQEGFAKETNLAFEDAIKKEFSLRCDTIEQLIVEKLMDTSVFEIKSELRSDSITYQYNVYSRQNKKDNWSFSSIALHNPLQPSDITFKKVVCKTFAASIRSEDLETHTVYYRTQDLGNFMSKKIKRYDFDTARLRPVLSHYLEERNISVPFQFYLREEDSTTNKSSFPKALLKKFPVITKSFPTYKFVENNNYVRAMFSNPFSYIIAKMKFILISSVLLIVLVLTSIFLLFKMWFREKKLSVIKNDFINNITHEFKTPIATVSAAVEALSDFDVLENKEKTTRYLGHSKKELGRLSSLVDQLLTISIYENEKNELHPELINVDSAVQQIIQSHQLASSKEVDFSFSNTTTVPAIKADKQQFHHAINNIIDNAIKYSGDKVTIDINCSIKDNFLVLTVTDNGNGIPASEIPFIFDKFYRAKQLKTYRIKGYGLGLNYVKKIIEMHGGWYSLKSKPAQGSSVSLAWPL